MLSFRPALIHEPSPDQGGARQLRYGKVSLWYGGPELALLPGLVGVVGRELGEDVAEDALGLLVRLQRCDVHLRKLRRPSAAGDGEPCAEQA